MDEIAWGHLSVWILQKTPLDYTLFLCPLEVFASCCFNTRMSPRHIRQVRTLKNAADNRHCGLIVNGDAFEVNIKRCRSPTVGYAISEFLVH